MPFRGLKASRGRAAIALQAAAALEPVIRHGSEALKPTVSRGMGDRKH